ncbi:hypothetical protein B0H14DRAFT_3490161 [Mycena olivaceomarginata]|nr:hypothetical protein B0H14DRAFT_3490161 [Mycena olivaceomarginata]
MFSALFITLCSYVIQSAATQGNVGPTVRNMTACAGSIVLAEGCIEIPIVSDSCIDFIGGFSFLNKEVSSVHVPHELVCTYFE